MYEWFMAIVSGLIVIGIIATIVMVIRGMRDARVKERLGKSILWIFLGEMMAGLVLALALLKITVGWLIGIN